MITPTKYNTSTTAPHIATGCLILKRTFNSSYSDSGTTTTIAAPASTPAARQTTRATQTMAAATTTIASTASETAASTTTMRMEFDRPHGSPLPAALKYSVIGQCPNRTGKKDGDGN